ncbi:MAG: holo-ACP synthase [Firmicutes bacterium]|nr:holo-ACP synthase [Bacillota bacterium]
MIVGVGCDVVQMNRFLGKEELFAKRVLTTQEYEQWKVYKERRRLEFLAGHFAAKEALVKAMDIPSSIFDYEIYYENQKPKVKKEGYQIHISISHEKEIAMAFAVVEKERL